MAELGSDGVRPLGQLHILGVDVIDLDQPLVASNRIVIWPSNSPS